MSSAGTGPTVTIHNARINLLATLLNNAGLAFMVAGFIAPLTGGQLHPGWRLAAVAVWVGVGVSLHFVARAVLRLLR
jgi:hypothetical protein